MIPNYLEDVKAAKVKYADAWTHAHVEGDPRQHEWIKLFAADLHKKDPKVALNGKRGNPLNLSMDALNILCDASDSSGRTPEGLPCVVVDVIGGAGGSNPQPTWSVFTDAAQGSGAHVIPGTVPTPEPPAPTFPSYEDIGGDSFYRAMVGVPLAADYAVAGQTLNDGSAVWFSRTIYDVLQALVTGHGSADPAAIVKKHRNEWRVILGLPPL